MTGDQGPLLELKNISKAFASTKALTDVDFTLQRGEVHALIGENGAGKSTLIKIIAGAEKSDRGTMFLEGRPFSPDNPLAARRQGIATIYQELSLAPHLNAVENMTLGREWHAWGIMKRRAMDKRARQVLAELKHAEIPLHLPMNCLSLSLQQVVEIARALVQKSRVIIMDEPTSSLSGEDMEILFRLVRKLAGEGIGVIYISHFLEEVMRVADRCTILRDGRNVHTCRIKDTSVGEMITAMLGRGLDEMYPAIHSLPGKSLLELDSLCGRRSTGAASFTLHSGEILGVTGLVGSGRTEMLQAIFGLAPVRSGKIRVKSIDVRKITPPLMTAMGIGYLSENRKQEGLALTRSIRENISLGNFRSYSYRGWINEKKEKNSAARWLQRLEIDPAHPDQKAETLSGGNQQKVALARLLHADADILLLDEPSRGIDIKAKSQIYNLIGEQVRAGKAIILVSSYFPELLGICHRIAVMHRGRITAIRPAAEWDEHSLLAHAMLGQAAPEHSQPGEACMPPAMGAP